MTRAPDTPSVHITLRLCGPLGDKVRNRGFFALYACTSRLPPFAPISPTRDGGRGFYVILYSDNTHESNQISLYSPTAKHLERRIEIEIMKFEKYLQEQVAPEFLSDPKYLCFQSCMVRYKILKDMINEIDWATSHSRRNEAMADECCICFEPFEFRSEAITTRCGHNFHPCCLIDAFSVQNSRGNCPLCRFPVAELVPTGLDGDVLRFLAMVRVNIDAADKCHEGFLRHLRGRVKKLLDTIHPSTKFGVFGRLLPGWGCEARKRQLAEDAARLRSQAAAAELFAAANRDGFRKILKKFDRRSGARPLSPHILPRLESRGFSLDAAAGPDGSRLAELRRQLTAAFRLPPEEPRPLHPQLPCIVPAVSAKCSASAVPAAGLSSAQGSGPVMAG